MSIPQFDLVLGEVRCVDDVVEVDDLFLSRAADFTPEFAPIHFKFAPQQAAPFFRRVAEEIAEAMIEVPHETIWETGFPPVDALVAAALRRGLEQSEKCHVPP